MKTLIAVLALLVSSSAFAQTIYTSGKFTCNQQVCNQIPLTQGGVWQFILANRAFSLNSNGFFIFGNPGAQTGGITNIVDQIPNPGPSGVGAPGKLTFDWSAVSAYNNSLHYTGNATVNAYQVRHCNNHGCWLVLNLLNAVVAVK